MLTVSSLSLVLTRGGISVLGATENISPAYLTGSVSVPRVRPQQGWTWLGRKMTGIPIKGQLTSISHLIAASDSSDLQ